MKSLLVTLQTASLLVFIATFTQADAPTVAPSTVPAESTNPPPSALPAEALPAEARAAAVKPNPHAPAVPLFRDTNTYPPLQVTWAAATDFDQVLGAFPHPTIIRRAIVTTTTGVSLTDDSGRTWSALPEASADKIGAIVGVAYDPLAPDTFYFASKTKGVWRTNDQGKTFLQIGSKASGMASDITLSLLVYAGDPSRQTLLVAHGDAAAGLSRTQDGGKTWDVVNGDYQFHRILGSEGNLRKIFLFGSAEKQKDIQCVYACTTIGEYLAEIARDVSATDLVSIPVYYRTPVTAYLATSDSGLERVADTGSSGLAYDLKPLPFAGVDDWSSVDFAWGPTADILNICLYDPAKNGLVITSDDFATSQTAGDGLPLSTLVKEGAAIRPNANGTVFYAVTNGGLSIGRQPDDMPEIDFTPSAFEVNAKEGVVWRDLGTAFTKFASAKTSSVEASKALLQSIPDPAAMYHQHHLIATARVSIKPAPPTSVTLDLSRYGGSPQTPMFDDGQHQDGAAGDGVYGYAFDFLPSRYLPKEGDGDWRSSWPGRVALGVSAAYPDGTHRGAVGVIGVYTQTFDNPLWENPKGITTTVEGDVVATGFGIDLPQGHGRPVPALRIEAKKGTWSVHIKTNYRVHGLSGYEAIALWVKVADGTAPKSLNLQLQDQPEFSAPTTTPRTDILNGLGLTGDYQRVIIPLPALTGQTPQFQDDRLGELILSADSDSPVALLVEGIQILVREDSSPADPANP